MLKENKNIMKEIIKIGKSKTKIDAKYVKNVSLGIPSTPPQGLEE